MSIKFNIEYSYNMCDIEIQTTNRSKVSDIAQKIEIPDYGVDNKDLLFAPNQLLENETQNTVEEVTTNKSSVPEIVNNIGKPGHRLTDNEMVFLTNHLLRDEPENNDVIVLTPCNIRQLETMLDPILIQLRENGEYLQNKQIIIPFNTPNHWQVILLQVKDNAIKIGHINTDGAMRNLSREQIEALKGSFFRCGFENFTWEKCDEGHIYQHCGQSEYNCGIITCLIIKDLVLGNHGDSPLNLKEKRDQCCQLENYGDLFRGDETAEFKRESIFTYLGGENFQALLTNNAKFSENMNNEPVDYFYDYTGDRLDFEEWLRLCAFLITGLILFSLYYLLQKWTNQDLQTEVPAFFDASRPTSANLSHDRMTANSINHHKPTNMFFEMRSHTFTPSGF